MALGLTFCGMTGELTGGPTPARHESVETTVQSPAPDPDEDILDASILRDGGPLSDVVAAPLVDVAAMPLVKVGEIAPEVRAVLSSQ